MYKEMKNHILSAIIGGLVVGVTMYFFIQKPEFEKQRILLVVDRVHTTLSETLTNTKNADNSVKDYIVRMLENDMHELMSYYDKTNDCEIGKEIKNFINTLVDMTEDKEKKEKWKYKITIINKKCN